MDAIDIDLQSKSQMISAKPKINLSFSVGAAIVIFYLDIREIFVGWNEEWAVFLKTMREWKCADRDIRLKLDDEESYLRIRTFDGIVLFTMFSKNCEKSSFRVPHEDCICSLEDLALAYAKDPQNLKKRFEEDERKVEEKKRLVKYLGEYDSSSEEDDADSVS